MADPTEYVFKLDSSGRPAMFPIPEKVVSNIHWFNTNRASNRIFHSVDGIEGVVIHATAGGSTSGALTWWRGTPPNGAKASAHWIVPDEDETAHGNHVWAVVYETLAAWHVRNSATSPEIDNKKKINHWTLGIEIVNRQNDSDTFSDWQYEVTALLVRYCWAKYPNMKYVFSHALVDPSRRSDPGDEFDWTRFEALVRSSDNDPAVDEEAENLLLAMDTENVPTAYLANKSCCM
ncbi:MAG: N-acetylmuramoyl-L-alanine amidase [Rhodobacteraceae bacterium]|nr:N-acetylmuramoyl-L-alanine amidase [Paracoccaceae bacterium]